MIMSHAADLLPDLNIGEVNFGDDHVTLQLVASNDDRALAIHNAPKETRPEETEVC